MWESWNALKERWFKDEPLDPVFEGIVRDFCTFDDLLSTVYQQVLAYMKGVEELSRGMLVLADGIHAASKEVHGKMLSDGCNFREACNRIARADAPHSAVVKLQRDMAFNILDPLQSHMANNRQLKTKLEIRQRRMVELRNAQRLLEEMNRTYYRNYCASDPKYLQAQANFNSARSSFTKIDRRVFEWLYILEEYRGDILDSLLQTLKYLHYELFSSSAHSISAVLPAAMVFRPMVEMVPEQLELQVKQELQGSMPSEETGKGGFSHHLSEKAPKDHPQSAVPKVDLLSLSSLLSQGFEEATARRALRLHGNRTQEALDWLVKGQPKSQAVRMPTLKRTTHASEDSLER